MGWGRGWGMGGHEATARLGARSVCETKRSVGAALINVECGRYTAVRNQSDSSSEKCKTTEVWVMQNTKVRVRVRKR